MDDDNIEGDNIGSDRQKKGNLRKY